MGEENNEPLEKVVMFINDGKIPEGIPRVKIKDIKRDTTNIVMDELDVNKKITKNDLCKKTYLRCGLELGELPKRNIYNEIMRELDKPDYQI